MSSTSAEVRPITGHALPTTPFATYVVADGKHAIVALFGELDIATADDVRSAVHELRSMGATHILIDLRPLEFMDSQGPRVLFDLQDEPGTNGNGSGIALVPGQGHVQRVFDLTRTRACFTWTTPPGSATP